MVSNYIKMPNSDVNSSRIIIIIFYKIKWIFGVLGWILPAMTLLKLLISVWVMLPQFKGEFFVYHMLEAYIL